MVVKCRGIKMTLPSMRSSKGHEALTGKFGGADMRLPSGKFTPLPVLPDKT